MEVSMFRKILRLRCAGAGFLLTAAVILSCSKTVAVTIMGPPELSGSAISLDGVHVGEFSRAVHGKKSYPAGVFATLRVSRGEHELEIRGPGFPPIMRKVNYQEAVWEDYIWIELPKTRPE
jgi:hypothetical protein